MRTAEQDELRRVHTHHEIIEHVDAAGGATVNGSASTVALATERTITDSRYFTYSAGEITVNRDGRARIRADVTLGTTGSGDYEYAVWLEKDSSEIAGTRRYAGKGT